MEYREDNLLEKISYSGRAKFTWSLLILCFCFCVAILVKILVPSSSILISFLVAMAHGIPSYFSYIFIAKRFPSLPLWLAVFGSTPIGILIGGSTGYLVYAGIAAKSSVTLPLSITDYLLLGFIFSSFASLMFYWRGQMLLAMEEQQENVLKLANQEKLLIESQLRALQAQIEPHFLFNTLANVQGLIDPNPAAAKQMLESFTRLLRHTLQRSRNNHTTLSQELEIVQEYLSIQKQRLGKRLNFQIRTDDALSAVTFPSLLLQPLVENAIRHGIEPSLTGGNIDITIYSSSDKLIVTVSDTGQGFIDSKGNGLGLTNVRERLVGLYGIAAQLTIKENTPNGVIATLEVPLA